MVYIPCARGGCLRKQNPEPCTYCLYLDFEFFDDDIPQSPKKNTIKVAQGETEKSELGVCTESIMRVLKETRDPT